MATAAKTGLPSHTSREARRRRILERGSDRLALITGSIQSLPPEPEPDQSRFSTDQIPATDSCQNEDAASNPLPPNEENGREHEQQSISDNMVKPLPHINQSGTNISSRSVSAHDTNEESPLISSSMQQTAHNHQSDHTKRSLLTPAQIKSAIAASESARMFSSIAVAVLVIASYMGLFVGFHNTSRIIIFRPVYLLLLTNITLVLGLAILGGRGLESRMGRRRSAPSDGGNDLADQLWRALEIGLLMQKILGAVFMDFSIYAVVLVSGLSVVRTLGW